MNVSPDVNERAEGLFAEAQVNAWNAEGWE
jgi:hypothetical protein